MTEKKKNIDWQQIRSDWEKSDNSIRWLATWYQVSESAIRKKAKQEGWPDRPKKARNKVRTKDAPRADRVEMAGIDATDPEQIVGKGHNLIFRLLDELDASTTHHAELAEMIELHEEDPRRRAAMLKAIELPGRANVIKALATAFKTWNESQQTQGKKAKRQEAAEEVAKGKFAPRGGPKLAVDNSK